MNRKAQASTADFSPCDDVGVLSHIEFICPHCEKKIISNGLITYDEYFNPPKYVALKCSNCGKETDVYFRSKAL